ncbi:MAG: acetylxylan esterase [Acidobacteria bacterium]|nr:MAG: acetylxylan esterase [Acidobacteriota bacterium]
MRAFLLLLPFVAIPGPAQSEAERMAADYFRAETARLARRALADVRSLDDWKSRREAYRAEMREMLGLEPLPPKTDLKATLTGRLETGAFVVEKIHFQSLPGLYVTGSLYLPKRASGRAPSILYLCGHARVFTGGVAYGNKTAYQHHPAWFAEHGYVAFIIDTLDLGEIEGEHHGTFRRGWWWWPTRGYTPAGVETWNAVRALDYLTSRPEVDPARIGVTGRSGGGAYTWFLAAVDDRPSVLVPVAGITDLTNHVVDGCIEGHCDCMYPVNTYGWDFTLLAALAAPRPLLLANSDADRIFPLDGVVRVHRELERIYRLYDARAKLGLFIAPGPHSDTQELQLASFRWMNRWLSHDDGPVAEVAEKRFTPEALKVFGALPADAINTRIHDTFVPAAAAPAVPTTHEAWEALAARWRRALREKVTNNVPALDPERLEPKVVPGAPRLIAFSPDPSYRLEAALVTAAAAPAAPRSLRVRVGGPVSGASANSAVLVVYPRGTGATAWPEAKDVQIRRRFLLLGRSLELVQALDVRAALLAALRSVPELSGARITLEASGPMCPVALFAALEEERIAELVLENPPASFAGGSFPNALRILDLPQALALVLPRAVTIRGSERAAWEWTVQAAQVAGGTVSFK